jgi:23S rRNA (adenine2503-C2)-methyltransferase
VILNDLTPASFEAQVQARFGANPSEARKLFAAVHSPRGVCAHGEPVPMLAQARGLRRTVLDAAGAEGTLPRLEVLERFTSPRDGFVRYLFAGPDGAKLEAVRIPLPCLVAGGPPVPERLARSPHYVVCVSSQVGCALGCTFCATGKLGFNRNLATWEIVEQLRIVRTEADRPVRGVVFMGMGEPFLNYDRVMAAAEIFSSPSGYAISADHITVSTAGVVPGIRRFTAEKRPYRLSVSLTAATSEKRRQVMPIEETWPLPELIAAVREHQSARGGRSMLAWVAIEGFNVGDSDARELAALCEGLPIRLDLIDVADPDGHFRPPDAEALSAFRQGLQILGQPVVRRYSGGRDIDAGCGMLAGRESREGGAPDQGR